MRGTIIDVYPFQYNPVSKTLRVYTNIVVEVHEDGEGNINIKERSLNRLVNGISKKSYEFNEIYNDHFLNSNSDTRCT